MLAFRIELAESLTGTYRGRTHNTGQPHAVRDDVRLKPELHHLPVYSSENRDCACGLLHEKEEQHTTITVASLLPFYLFHM